VPISNNKTMNVWIIQIGEPNHIDDEGRARLRRTGILCDFLQNDGHNVTWWDSTFSHQTKEKRFIGDKLVKISDLYSIKLIDAGICYSKNISISRLLHDILSSYFIWKKLLLETERPDIILAPYPCNEVCFMSVYFASKFNIPIVVDIRDLWIDVLKNSFLKRFKLLMPIVLYPYKKSLNYIINNSSSVIGMSEKMLDEVAEFIAIDEKNFFYSGYQKVKEKDKMSSYNMPSLSNNSINLIFIGALSSQFNLSYVLETVVKLNRNGILVGLVICGDGDLRKFYQEKSNECDNILFTGWLNKYDIDYLMGNVDVGIAPYLKTKTFLTNIPNKPIEYISAGLPVLSSVEGELGNLLRLYGCGLVYKESGKDSLYNIIEILINNKEQIKKMSDNAHFLYDEKFHPDKIYPTMISFFEKTIKNYSIKHKEKG